MRTPLTAFAVPLLAAVCLNLSAAEPPKTSDTLPPLSAEDLRATVASLGADEYGARELASRVLLRHVASDTKVLAALSQARRAHIDPEVRARASRVLTTYRRSLGEAVYIKDFHILGPFPYDGAERNAAISQPTPLETLGVNLTAVVPDRLPGKEKDKADIPLGKPLKWVRPYANENGDIDFRKLFPEGSQENQNVYCLTFIRSAEDAEAVFHLGSDDGAVVWVNGERVFHCEVLRALQRDQNRFTVQLYAGWNPVLVRISQGGGGWQMSLRVTDTDEMPWPAKDIDPLCGGDALPSLPPFDLPAPGEIGAPGDDPEIRDGVGRQNFVIDAPGGFGEQDVFE